MVHRVFSANRHSERHERRRIQESACRSFDHYRSVQRRVVTDAKRRDERVCRGLAYGELCRMHAAPAARRLSRVPGGRTRQADARIDGVVGARAAAAERDDASPSARMSVATSTRPRRRQTERTGAPGSARARAQHVARAAERRPPCAQNARPPRRCRALARPAPPASTVAARPPRSSSRAASARVTAAAAARERAGQEVDRLADFERVAGRRAEHLVHVGDERARGRPAPAATSTRLAASARASRARA